MHSPLIILAQDAGSGDLRSTATTAFERMDMLFRPNELMDELSRLPFMWAAVLVTLGILTVFNGYRWHKWIIAILAFLFGIGLGYTLSRDTGRPAIVATAMGCLFAIIATPLMRITVALFGGATGAFIGANAWTAAGTDTPDAHWVGAVIGFIVIAMLSVIFFRLVIVLFTSVGGALLAVCGGITLLLHVPSWEPSVREGLASNEMLVPLLILLASVSGFVIQESRLRSSGVSIVAQEGKKE
jgi:hypothetical protein